METVWFEEKKHLGVIARYGNGWTKEINLISWNGTEPRYDIRDWNETHEHMSKGITLSEEELNNLIVCVLDEILGAREQ